MAFDKLSSSCPQCPRDECNVTLTGNHDYWPVKSKGSDFAKKLNATQVWHAHIGDHAASGRVLNAIQKSPSRGIALNYEIRRGQQEYQALSGGIIVINHVNGEIRHRRPPRLHEKSFPRWDWLPL